MGVASGCGEQEVGVASGSGWNLWVWLLGVVVRRYIDFLIYTTYPYSSCIYISVLFCSSIPTFCSFFYINRVNICSVFFCMAVPKMQWEISQNPQFFIFIVILIKS